ncbi:hypothetical protein ACET3Z_022655 [Daucus carota]
MSKVSHVLAIPFPAQGHVIPMMELVRKIAQHGIRVTFVNTDFNHKRVMKALSNKEDDSGDLVHLVSVPDGLEPGEDRNDIGKLFDVLPLRMRADLVDLIQNINSSTDKSKISCVIADGAMSWAMEVAEDMGIKRAFFWPASTATLSSLRSIHKLIQDGVLDTDGGVLKPNEIIQLSPTMPAMSTSTFVWTCFTDLATRKNIFDFFLNVNEALKLTSWIVCNSARELEPAAFTLFPDTVPIGPLSASNELGHQAGHFWAEDSACVSWLDQQPAGSVIYVAFGSFTVFDQSQFRELALGLELTNKPFLWVVRPDMTDGTDEAYPEGFEDRIGCRGRMVGWSPQEKVLRHPSVACFISHCGWNSTTEGVSNGVPFLCWPYFADQLLNETYICDVWKVGLGFEKNENGIITKGEIKKKVEMLLGDKDYKERAMVLKEKLASSVQGDGLSNTNLRNFIQWMN